MKLKEMKAKTFSLIEEYYPELSGLAEDEDVLNKIDGVINSIQMDLMKYRKINASEEIVISKEDSKVINLKDVLDDVYQLNKIVVDKDIDYQMPNDDTLILPKDYEGTITIYYFKYPTLVNTMLGEEEKKTQDETFEFELDKDILEIMPYGVAADILKMDMISGYGRYFYERYMELRNTIDPRRSNGSIRIVGGVNV
jgi:hypothetical protein